MIFLQSCNSCTNQIIQLTCTCPSLDNGRNSITTTTYNYNNTNYLIQMHIQQGPTKNLQCYTMLSRHTQITQQVTKLSRHMHLTYFKPIHLQEEALTITCTRTLTTLLTSHFTSSHFATFSSLTLAHYLHLPHHTGHYLHIETHSHLLLHFSYLHSPNGMRLIFIDVGIGRWWRV